MIIAVTAMVARIARLVDPSSGRSRRGMGLDFFLFDARSKARWQSFLRNHFFDQGLRKPTSSANPAPEPMVLPPVEETPPGSPALVRLPTSAISLEPPAPAPTPIALPPSPHQADGGPALLDRSVLTSEPPLPRSNDPGSTGLRWFDHRHRFLCHRRSPWGIPPKSR